MVGNAVTMSNHRFLVKCCSNMTVKGACTLGGRQLQHVCKLSLSGVCTESRRPPMSANCSVELLKQLCSPWESFIQAVLQFLQEKITNILQWTNPKTCVLHQDFAAMVFPEPIELAPLRFSRRPAVCLTHTVLLFSAVWLCTVTGSDSVRIVPEWVCAALAPSAKSRSVPVATSDKNKNTNVHKKKKKNLSPHRRSWPANTSQYQL